MIRLSWLANRRVFFVWILMLPLVGCASTGATIGSGVGDRQLTGPPYYAGDGVPDTVGVVIAHIPITYQRGANQEDIFDPAHSAEMASLLDDLNSAIDAMGVSRGIAGAGETNGRIPPDVQFNCWTDGFHDDECAVSGDTALGRGRQTMRLAVGRPSPEWVEWLGPSLAGVGGDVTLVITLEVGNYFVRQRGLSGTKEIELGTDHVAALPWVTSLETPVSVIQLTGAIVDRDGRALRIGAEGLLPRRTPFLVSSIDAQALITDTDVSELRRATRDDLPGNPPVWKAGLHALVEGLLGAAGP